MTTFMTDGHVDEARFLAVFGELIRRVADPADGTRHRVVIFGEMVALIAAEGDYEAAIERERCWNVLQQQHPFALRCGYPMGMFTRSADGEVLARVCDAHTTVRPTEHYTALTSDDERSSMIALLQQKAQILQHEIAARARADQALLERNRELRAAIAAREEFLAVAAHELRTPVTGLRGYAQLLLRQVQSGREIPPERLAKSLAIVEQQTNQLSALVGRLLDTTQIDAGKLRVEPVATDLVTLVQSLIAQQPLSATHPLLFGGPASLVAREDPVRFEQVVTNLIDNAVKYSPQGGMVRVELVDQGSGGIKLSVTDAGMGIPVEEREAVFTRFHRAHRDDNHSGLGLGLFVSREIVELHGGSIRIEDPPDPGTRMVITLPHPAA